MKKWNLLNDLKANKSSDLVNILLENRGIKTDLEKKEFLNPDLSQIKIDNLNIDLKELKKTITRIEKAINNKEDIIVFGDYDVDGICGSAILWETLDQMGAQVLPYIPSRFEEGYGLSKKGIDVVLESNPNLKLIITVDNGIVASDAVDYANEKGLEVIITDHHVPSSKTPKAFSIVHTTSLCGAGVAYILSKELKREKIEQTDNHLVLVVLATIADLVPLNSANRILVFFGLNSLRHTQRPGLLALFKVCGINPENIGVYEIGHMIAPRLNAMGRLLSAMDSLRLVCTTNSKRASDLADVLSSTNLQRQEITADILIHAKTKAKEKLDKNFIFLYDESYQQGVIGLVAGRLVEEFYLPSIVISKGEKFSKASARSVKGFNIIEFLREVSDLLVDVGGHPMAAGFTVETEKLDLLEKAIYEKVAKIINKDYLERVLNIDFELDDSFISEETFQEIQKLSPFGMANPEPLFLTNKFKVSEIRKLGKEGKHLKLKLKSPNNLSFEAIAFGMAEKSEIKIEDFVSLVYTIDINIWNGNKNLQLNIKDYKLD